MKLPRRGVLAGATAASGALAAWSLFEAQWVELREVEVPLPGLPPELDGFRILHLSDFHLGTLSLNARAVDRAVRWGRSRDPDLVVITGDLLSRRRGEAVLGRVLRALPSRHGVFAVLGNHDVGETRDPLSRRAELRTLDETGATLLSNSSRSFEARGVGVQVVGVAPSGWRLARPAELADEGARLRILLCHFPDVVERLPRGSYDLVLAGHLHGGQISLPTPRGKIRLEHLRARYWEGLHRTPAGALHVSRGLGTSFVPFRFLARPEATELTLRREN